MAKALGQMILNIWALVFGFSYGMTIVGSNILGSF
jgi:hypothetical protein